MDGLTQIFLRYSLVHFYRFKNHVEEWNDIDNVNYILKYSELFSYFPT